MTHENSTQSGRIVRALRAILEAIAAAEAENQRHRQGSMAAGRTRLGYEFSIGHHPGTDTHRQQDQPKRAGSGRATAVRYMDENVLVTIDAPETDPATVSAGTDDRTGELLLAIDRTIEERIPLQQRGLEIVDSSFTNGILDIRLQPTEGTEE